MSKKKTLKSGVDETDKNIKKNDIRLLNCSTGHWMTMKQNHQNSFQLRIIYPAKLPLNYKTRIKAFSYLQSLRAKKLLD